MTAFASSRAKSRKPKRDWKLFFVLVPFIILTFIFAYIPLFGWSYAFIDFKPALKFFDNQFVGLQNFRYMFTDRIQILSAMKNTVIFAALGYAVSWIPMGLALLLNEIRSSKYRKVIQTATTLPNFISWIIVYSLAFQMFSYEGLVSTVLQQLGLADQPVSVLTSDRWAYFFQTAVSQWKGAGWGSIIYMAAIAGIDQELYEAAAVDGAGRYRRLWHITLPALLPTFIVLQLLAVSSFVSVGFEQYFVFRNPITSAKLDVIDVYTYIIGLTKQNYSYATAIGIVKSLISLTLLFLTNRLAAKIRGNTII